MKTTKSCIHMVLFLVICIFISGCSPDQYTAKQNSETENIHETYQINNNCKSEYPPYSGEAFIEINGNIPFFTEYDITTQEYETYSPLDDLGRPGMAFACLGTRTMPPEGEERGEIDMIKPAGWHTVKYPDTISDRYLYNRCHLIGWQLSNENANELNLITGTRYLNVTGMLPFENMVADYIRRTDNHVMYRVTPVYTEDNLLCDGLLMEAWSVEDDMIRFCVYCYNVQPGIGIDYATGESWELNETNTEDTNLSTDNNTDVKSVNHYVINNNSMKIHDPECPSVSKISNNNREDYYGSLNDLMDNGYTPCKQCDPK